MKASEKIISLVTSFTMAEEIVKQVRWNNLSRDDREMLLVKAVDLRDNPQGFQLLKTLHYLAINEDEVYDCRVLLLILDRQDIKELTREQITSLITKRLKNPLKQVVSDAKQLPKIQEYFVIKARYTAYMADTALEKNNIKDAIRFLQSAVDAYRLAESEDLAVEVEQKLLGLLNEDKVVELENKIIALDQSISALTAQVGDKNQEITAQTENLKRQQNQILEGQKYLEKIVKQVSDAQGVLADQKKEFDSIATAIQETRAELGTLGRLKSMQQVIPEFEAKKLRLENSLTELANQKNKLKLEILSMMQDHEDMKSQLAAAQDLVIQKQTLSAEIADSQSRLESLRLENQNVEIEYDNRAKMRRKIAAIRQEKEALLAEIDELQLKVAEAKSYTERIASLEAEEKTTRAELRRMNKKKEDLNQQISALGEQIQGLNQPIDPSQKNTNDSPSLIEEKIETPQPEEQVEAKSNEQKKPRGRPQSSRRKKGSEEKQENF